MFVMDHVRLQDCRILVFDRSFNVLQIKKPKQRLGFTWTFSIGKLGLYLFF
jgi:hypothetical protein